jgi:hypothetical protein
MRGGGILFSEMTPPPGHDHEFNAWYDEEHIPVRMKAPGFVSAQRYRAHDGNGYLAVYEVDSLAAFDTPAYKVIKTQPSDRTRWMLTNVSGFTRYLGNETFCTANADPAALNAPVLYAVWFNVPPDRAADFDAWYEQDHIPILMTCKDWLMVRRFKIVDGEPESWTHLALHYLNDVKALESPERQRARQTPWRDRLAAEPWFKGKYTMFDRHKDRHIACPPV